MEEPAEPGVVRCMRCRRKFVSPDPVRVRRCHACKADDYVPRTGRAAAESKAASDAE